MKKMPLMLRLAGAVIILSAAASCEHKELCYDHFDHALKYSTRISATYDLAWELTEPGGPDWESDWPESFGFSYESMIRTAPAGLRVISTCEGGSGRMSSVNIAACGGEVGLAPGYNSLLLYNNDTEYIIFNNLSALASAKATTRSRTRGTYSGNPLYCGGDGRFGKENTVSPPDVLWGGYIDGYY